MTAEIKHMPTRLRLVSEADPADVRREDQRVEYERIVSKVGPLSVTERARVAALRTMLGLDEG